MGRLRSIASRLYLAQKTAAVTHYRQISVSHRENMNTVAMQKARSSVSCFKVLIVLWYDLSDVPIRRDLAYIIPACSSSWGQ